MFNFTVFHLLRISSFIISYNRVFHFFYGCYIVSFKWSLDNNKDKTVELEFDNQFKEEKQNKIKNLFKKIEDIVKESEENK